MNPKKSGKFLAVLMLAIFAYGCGSSLSLAVSDTISLELPTIVAADDGQISIINNPDFEPVFLRQRIIVNVINNTTDETIYYRNETTDNGNNRDSRDN